MMKTVQKTLVNAVAGFSFAVVPAMGLASGHAPSGDTTKSNDVSSLTRTAIPARTLVKSEHQDDATLVYDFDNPTTRTVSGKFVFQPGFKVLVKGYERQVLPAGGVKILSATQYDGLTNLNRNAVTGTTQKFRLRLRDDGLFLYKVKGICVGVR